MLTNLRKNFAEANYGMLGLEIIVVIIGILIAIQIDRWAEDRREREQEHNYLLRLKADLQVEIRSMDQAIQFAESRIAAVLLLEEIIENPAMVREQPDAVPAAMETATWMSFPQINAFVYSELQSSGNLALIRSEPLRRELANHYASIRHYSRFGFERVMEHQFDRLTAGILSTAELLKIEEETWNNSPNNISIERAIEITQELAGRQDAIDLLPSVAQHNVFTQKVIKSARSRALKIIEQIDSLIEEFED